MAYVTLVRCPTILPIDSVTAHQGVPSLALAYLSAALSSAGHETFCIDALGEKLNHFQKLDTLGLLINGLSAEEIVQKIPHHSDMIGISCMFSNEWIYTKRIIRKIQESHPEKKIILGGEHATSDYREILEECPYLYAVALGEGEETIKELASFKERENITGIAYKTDTGLIVVNSRRPRISEIDQISWPEWDKLPLENYLDLGLGMAMQRKRSMPMIASRGCPYTCSFCSSPEMWTTNWQARKIDQLILEMKFYHEKYKIDHFEFYDLTTIINKNWTLEFSKKLVEENLKVTWSLPSGTRSEALTEEVLYWLKKSGCSKLTYAPESGSTEMLKKIKKKVRLDNMLRSMRAAVKKGIVIKANMIFGFPDQTWKDIFWDYLFLFRMALAGVHDVTCFAFVPYPGSELFKRLLSEGRIIRDENYESFLSFNVYNAPTKMKSWSNSISDWQLPYLTLGGMSFFYFFQFLFRPWRFFVFTYRTLTRKPLTMIELAVDGMIEDFLKGRKLIKTESSH